MAHPADPAPVTMKSYEASPCTPLLPSLGDDFAEA
jgi:hypothetical protein